jgi:hypothetical protein
MLSEHTTQADAFAAYRAVAEPQDDTPCLLVRLEDFGLRQVTIIAARGVMPDALETDPAFLDSVRRTCGVVRARYDGRLW